MVSPKRRVTEAERIRESHVTRLAAAAADVELSRRALDEAVADARQSRLSWGRIGNAVGMTRQGTRQKWGL